MEITATGATSLDQLKAKLQVRSLAGAFPSDPQS